MKKRSRGFVAEDKIDHDGEIFDYIRELHEYLWRVVHIVYPEAGGSLRNFLDPAMTKLESKVEKDDLFLSYICECGLDFHPLYMSVKEYDTLAQIKNICLSRDYDLFFRNINCQDTLLTGQRVVFETDAYQFVLSPFDLKYPK